ncbi:MAG: SUMF1/EgtB/PvdO family nonheme iron enzyme [Candidatus Eremiobacteraeota bacterium]|nr:SUMF1/EgtB/PvdO family nonheme iron enzyme [Candidatus Eremiobacteraeota bacterium]
MIEANPASQIAELLRDARCRSLALTADLSDEQLHVPMLDIVNPLLWEMGHVAYFAEFWTLRRLYDESPIIPNADSLYDSARIPHDDRWLLQLPTRPGTLRFMTRQLEAVESHLRADGFTTPESEYFHRLILSHEDMHGEALVYTRQTLEYAAPNLRSKAPGKGAGGPFAGDVVVPAGPYSIGSRPSDGFVFDNEKWAHEVSVQRFSISRAPVTNAEYAAFVNAGGYSTREVWSNEGWDWLQTSGAEHPIYWRSRRGSSGSILWERRHFDRWAPLAESEPICHVNWFEANAYCAWADRRLPSEAEWEVAATGGDGRRYPWGDDPPSAEHANLDALHGGPLDVGALPAGDSPVGCRQMIGNVWEWTASAFEPYPGYVVDPYKEYSAPWFGTHKVLRGGAWSTRARLITARWRNFYRPHRRDIITGFRTCAR